MLTPGIIEWQYAFSNVFQFYISLIRINKSQTRDLKIYNALFPDFKFLQDFSSVIKGFLPRSFRLSFRSVSVHLFFFRVPRLLFFTSRPSPPPSPLPPCAWCYRSSLYVVELSSSSLRLYVAASSFFDLLSRFLCLVSRTYIFGLKEKAICKIVILYLVSRSNELVIPFPIVAT